MSTTDAECLDRLRRAGWTLGDTAFHSLAGRLVWVVSGYNGENQILAHGKTSSEAWLAAVEQIRPSVDRKRSVF